MINIQEYKSSLTFLSDETCIKISEREAIELIFSVAWPEIVEDASGS